MIVFLAVPSKGTVTDGKLNEKFLRFVAKLHTDNPHVSFVSPMINGYSILPYLDSTDATWATWGDYCRRLVAVSDQVWILMFEGWDESEGLNAEFEYTRVLGKEVVFVPVV